MRILENRSLMEHNTFHLDIKARWFIEYESEADLLKLLRDEYFLSQPFLHIGSGSNLLFLGDYEGAIVHSAIRGREIVKEDERSLWLQVGAGENWDDLVVYCVGNGWGGIENLSLIPGEVGATAVQNIGAYGMEVAQVIEEVHAYHLPTHQKRIFTNAECSYSYRDSFFKQEENRGLYFITHVVYRLSKQADFLLDYGNLKDILHGQKITLQTIRDAVCQLRRTKLPDPGIEGNAGSFFMNPYICIAHYDALKKRYPALPHYPVDNDVVKIPAAWLIEQCGLKGTSLGGAAVSEKQALVIINRDHATGSDIAHLAEKIRLAVKERFDIDLCPEVNYV
jgi:UDP-N-acetylmuramate dehydrogenase